VVTGKRRVGVFNAETQRRREAEKMKHSGIPWIGTIPERWKLARLKNCAKVFGRIGFRGYTTADIVNEGEGALSLSPSNLKDIRMDYAKRTYISWSKYEESPEIKVYKGDIVFVKTGSSYGKACIVDDMPCEATLNPQLVVLKCFSCHNRYLNYYLQTPLIKYQVELIVSGGTIPTMSQEKMGCWKIILPPLSEQQAIADYLDEKCAAIDAMIVEKEVLIADLEAYKKSLIYETVTGKREVK
jgi:type I restriction enzyme S subunit